jgi:DNA-binding NtrC family response regulator
MSKIAIIDDDSSVRNSIEIVLNSNGHTTVSFTDPQHFLATANVSEFDLLLVDNDMPHMTGLELHEWLRSNFSEHPKFVLMSGRIVKEDLLATEKTRQITLLSKPFPLAKLLELVSS